MPAEQTDRWPRFTLVTYSRPTGIPNGWDEELLEHGAPDGLACQAVPQLILLHDADSGPLVGFATHGPSLYLCLDPRTKHVVEIIVDRGVETGNPAYGKVRRSACVVNSGLDQFITSVRAVTNRFPFDREGEEHKHGQLEAHGYPYPSAFWDTISGEWGRAAEEVHATLRDIDAAAVANPDGFWMTFIADEQMGSYGTRYVLNPPDFLCADSAGRSQLGNGHENDTVFAWDVGEGPASTVISKGLPLTPHHDYPGESSRKQPAGRARLSARDKQISRMRVKDLRPRASVLYRL